MGDARARLAAVKSRIADSAKHAGRDPKDVTLIAVSKTFDAAAIEPVLEAGQREFGENRVQEAQNKWPALRARYPDVRLNLIGPLQTNKAREAVALFDAIHSLDRERLALALVSEMQRRGTVPRIFVQVNTGGEAQKSGVAPGDAVAFVERCRREHGLAIDGIMCIPPLEENPVPHFKLLKQLAGEAKVSSLSMGMSADFETAIEQGATHVRVGSAIFGERK